MQFFVDKNTGIRRDSGVGQYHTESFEFQDTVATDDEVREMFRYTNASII